MKITADELKGIVENIWTSVLGLPIAWVDGERSIPGASFTSCVHITGAWSGAVVLACSVEVTRWAAATMFGMGDAEIGESEMRDAVGELANIAGGNFKSLLPKGCQLSLPTVVEGEQYTLVVTNSRLLSQQAFDSEGKPSVVKVFERDVEKAA